MSLDRLLNQTIRIFKDNTEADNTDDYGRLKYDGSSVEVPCRIEFNPKTRYTEQNATTPGGSAITIVGQAVVKGDVNVDQNDRVEFEGNQYRVNGVYPMPGRRGKIHNLKLELVSWRTT